MVAAAALVAGACAPAGDAGTTGTATDATVSTSSEPPTSASVVGTDHVDADAVDADAVDDTDRVEPGDAVVETDAVDADDPVVATDRVESGKSVRTAVDGVDAILPSGFSTVTVRITSAEGERCDVCMWLADTSAERSVGLMGVTDLGDAVGMAFGYADDTESRFHMSGTPTPLSIAWFDRTGAFVSRSDMEPCLGRPRGACVRYSADAPYTLAIEMFQGELEVIGIGPGSTAVIVGGTEAPTCLD